MRFLSSEQIPRENSQWSGGRCSSFLPVAVIKHPEQKSKSRLCEDTSVTVQHWGLELKKEPKAKPWRDDACRLSLKLVRSWLSYTAKVPMTGQSMVTPRGGHPIKISSPDMPTGQSDVQTDSMEDF